MVRFDDLIYAPTTTALLNGCDVLPVYAIKGKSFDDLGSLYMWERRRWILTLKGDAKNFVGQERKRKVLDKTRALYGLDNDDLVLPDMEGDCRSTHMASTKGMLAWFLQRSFMASKNNGSSASKSLGSNFCAFIDNFCDAAAKGLAYAGNPDLTVT